MKALEHRTDLDALFVQGEMADRAFMQSAALFEDGDRLRAGIPPIGIAPGRLE